MERKYLFETNALQGRGDALADHRAKSKQPAWWADVLSGRVRKDWAAMSQNEVFEDWARRSTLAPATAPSGDIPNKR